ncbi:hypothetical protein HPB50_018817 [Hyalomma asiaticum]|uniref:Uncharacterized protein n=1 Tax=Hyalomma asiaticum TaxID=266040 RepID=A0ACB7SIL9_HYAAI|nr:hypothetical protein HPB50_018817 [Hyalomma asiaticum]
MTASLEIAIPDFHGFKDNPAAGTYTVDSIALTHSWPESVKNSIPKRRGRRGAQAWHRFQGSTYAPWSSWRATFTRIFAPLPSTYDTQFMEMRSRRQAAGEHIVAYICAKLYLLQASDIARTSPAARRYVFERIREPMHAAMLAVPPVQGDIETFVRRAAELQGTASGDRMPASHIGRCFTGNVLLVRAPRTRS